MLRILRRRAPIALITFLAVCGAAAYFTAQMPKIYQAQSRVLIESPADGSAPNGIEAILRAPVSPLETEIEKIKSRSFLLTVASTTKPLENKDPDAVRSQLTLTPGVGGHILDISVRAKTAQEAQSLANTTAQLYIKSALAEFEEKTDESEARLKRAKQRTSQVKKDAEQKMAAFNTKVGLSDPAVLYSQRAGKTVQVANELEDAQKKLPLLQQQLANYRQQAQTIAPTIATGFTQNKNPVIDGFKAELSNLRLKRTAALRDFLPDSDEVKFIDSDIAEHEKEIKQAENDIYSKGSVSFARNPDYSEAQSNVYRTQLAVAATKNDIIASESMLRRMKDEQKVLTQQKNQYDSLKRAQDAAIIADQQTSDGISMMNRTRVTSMPHLKLMDEAQLPPTPVSPKPLLNAVMAIFMGLFLGVGVAVLAEYFAATASEETEPAPQSDLLLGLPHVAGVPLLGRVPLSALPSPASAGTNSGLLAPSIVDAVREVGYVLAHGDDSGKPPVVLVSGTQNTDAAASLTAQIAAALSRDGLRVTLIDADRTHPRLNRVFGAPDAPGMADVLAGRVRAREILHIGAGGGLRFLAAGSPDDAAPTTEAGARELFSELADARDTDIVLVSGPTVWAARRIAPLEKAASGMVLVAEQSEHDTHSTGPDETVARARRMLSNGYRPRLLGVVVSSGVAPVAAPAAMPTAGSLAAPASETL